MADEQFIQATGVILAGGKSTRFGSDKALATIKERPLIGRVKNVLGSIFNNLLIVANRQDEYAFLELDIFPDIIPALGPMGGIYTGLQSMKDEWGFFAACDMPYIRPKLVRRMFELHPGFDVVAPRIGRMIEPLHAFYHKRCIESIEDVISSGHRQVILFYKKVRVRYLDEDELRAVDPELDSFFNINFPRDLPAGN